MDEHERESFTDMLETVLAGYGQTLPAETFFNAWLKFLKPYPMNVIRQAFAEHCQQSEFPPRPVDISRRCRESDGRPTADEAWATALVAIDENSTVVWTEETSQAFFLCKPILERGDKVGARRAFIDAYNRLIQEARTNHTPCHYFASLGKDSAGRQTQLETAQNAGLISYNPATMLPAPDDVNEEQRAKVRAKIAELRMIVRGAR